LNIFQIPRQPQRIRKNSKPPKISLMQGNLSQVKLDNPLFCFKGPSIKDVRTGLPLPPLSVRIHHKFRKSRWFLHQKARTSTPDEPPPSLSEKCPYWTNPTPPDCGCLLWTAPNN